MKYACSRRNALIEGTGLMEENAMDRLQRRNTIHRTACLSKKG